MADFTERIRLIIDTQVDKATTALGNFRKAVGEADGVTGKFKAGWSSASQAIQQNAGALAMTVGPALVAFGVKAADQFSSMAKAAIDLGKATGFSTEEASRWIAVGDDYGVTAEQIATSVGRIDKSLDDKKWAEYGIATRDASGKARDANAIFLDTLDLLNKTPEGAERARIGAELMRNGWQGIAPLLGHTRSEYEKMLGSVENGQVITGKEAQQAEKWRLAMDQLHDALQEVTLAVGKAVSSFAPLLDTMGAGIEKVTALDDRFGLLSKSLFAIKDPFSQFHDLVGVASDQVDTASMSADEFVKTLKDVGVNSKDAASMVEDYAAANKLTTEETNKLYEALDIASPNIRDVGDESRTARPKIGDMAGALDKAAQNTKTLTDNFKDLLDELDKADELDKVADAFDKIKSSAEDAWIATTEGADDAMAKQRDYAASIRDSKREVIQYADELGNVPTEVVSKVLTLIDQGKFDEAKLIVASWANQPLTKTVDVVAKFKGSNIPIGGGKAFASGTESAPPGLALVGEQGPELVMFGGGEKVLNASRTASALSGARGAGTYNITVHAGNANAADVVRLLKEHIRRNGGQL